MAICIVTDSSCDLPPELVKQCNITVIPCYVVINDVTHQDGVDITADEFYQKLTTSQRLPTTAQPSAADFQSVYQDLLSQGHEVVSIHVSGKLSGTLNSAQQAKSALGNPASIEIIDSLLASIPLGLVVLQAAQLAQQGNSAQAVAQEVRRILARTNGFFLLDTLEYLQKGGRVGKAQAFVGSLLSVKPLLKLQNGEAHPVERPRNRERGLRRMVELVHELSPAQQLAVIYSTEPEAAREVRQRLADLLPPEQIIITRFGSTLGTYLGPKALGISVTSAS